MPLNLLDNLINSTIDRMTPEEKEKIVESALEKFLSALSPEEKQQLLEKLIPQFLEGVDKKAFLSHLVKFLWKEVEGDIKDFGIIEKVSKTASDTGGKISGMIPQRIKRIWQHRQEEEPK